MGKRISELDSLSQLSGEEFSVVSYNGVTYKVPVSLIKPVIDKVSLGIDQIDNTSDAAKPVSIATQQALDNKASIDHAHPIGSIFNLRDELDNRSTIDHVHTKSQIGLSHVDNTSDAEKPISDLTQVALDGKAPLLHNHSKADVGLGNVNNTSDLNKPISTATQAALDSKSSITHSHSKADIGLSNVDNTSDINKPVSTAMQSALNNKVNSSLLGSTGGVATLDANRTLSQSQIPNVVTDATKLLIESTADFTSQSQQNYTDQSISSLESRTTPIDHIGSGGSSHALATHETHGFISSEDKTKLDSLELNANFYVHPETHPASVIVQNSNNRFVTDGQMTSWNNKIPMSYLGVAGGVPTLDYEGKIPASQLPSYVDDILEYNSFNDLPITGETSKIYLTILDNKVYRWSGSVYIDLSPHSGKTLVSSVNGADGDVVISKETIGLDNVNNTSDLDKPISTATLSALNTKASSSHIHSTSEITNLDVILDNIDVALTNRSLISHIHEISGVTGLQDALNNKSDSSHTHTKADIGLGNVDNTSDLDKPISTVTQVALDTKSSIGHTHNLASDVVDGFISSGDKIKLDSIEPNANNYIHPNSHPASIIDQDSNNRFVTDSQITDWNSKQNSLGFVPEDSANKGVANGYASLDESGKIPSSQLPSYVDDILEYASSNAFPETGSFGKIYIATDTNYTYRWSGSVYIQLSGNSQTSSVESINGRTGIVVIDKNDVGLGNVNNTSDLAKPISTATQTALNTKAESVHGHLISDISGLQTQLSSFATITSLNNYYTINSIDVKFNDIETRKANVVHSHSISDITGLQTSLDSKSVIGHSHTKAEVGLGNVDNTSDVNKPISTAVQSALNTKVNTSSLGIASGVATLDATGKIPSTQLPSFVDDVLEFTTFANLPAIGETSKIYITTSDNKLFRWNGSAYVDLLSSISTGVSSVNTRTGAVTLTKADVGLSNVDNTSDASKPISTATQTALNNKASLTHTHTKADIGLSNVDNTSDINKPLSSLQKNYVDSTVADIFRTGSYGGAAVMLEPMSIMVNGEPQLLFNNSGSIIVSGVL